MVYSSTSNAGSLSPLGDTPQGLSDLAGNVWERCSDVYQGAPEVEADRYWFTNDFPSTYFLIRGGPSIRNIEGNPATAANSIMLYNRASRLLNEYECDIARVSPTTALLP